MSLKKVNNERLCVLLCNYSGRFVVLPHAQLPSLQPTRVNHSFTKYEAVYNVSMLGLNCAINRNSRNGERSCFLAVSMTECITAYASAPRNVRKSPATFCFVFAMMQRYYFLLENMYRAMMIFWLTCLVGYPRTSAPEPEYRETYFQRTV